MDFSGANLTAASFHNAKMGSTLKANCALWLLQFILGVVAGFFIGMGLTLTSLFVGDVLDIFNLNSEVNQWIFIIFFPLLFALMSLILVKYQYSDYFSSIFIAFMVLAVGSLIYIVSGLYLGWRAVKKEDNWLLPLRNAVLKFNGLWSTQFVNATVQAVDFTKADLTYARFNEAQIRGCSFQRAKNHHLILYENTPLKTRQQKKRLKLKYLER